MLLAIMHMIGLFDRPASGDCLNALRVKPAIEGLTDQIVDLDESEWQRAIARLREVRLLAPPDPAARGALDAHPLVREWFGERLRQANEAAWKAPTPALRAPATQPTKARHRHLKTSRRSIRPSPTAAALDGTRKRSMRST
jgi:hypothetical protein